MHRFEQRVQELGLTLGQSTTLAALARNEGLTQAKLAEEANVEPMTMVRMLDHMEAGGLLTRRRDARDRRVRRLFLTTKAKPLLIKIQAGADSTLKEALADVRNEERVLLMAVLQRMHDNLRALDDRRITSDSKQQRVNTESGMMGRQN